MLRQQDHPGRYRAYFRLLVIILLVEGVTFLASAIADISTFGKEQALSTLLRSVLAALSLAALAQVLHTKCGHPNHGWQLALPGFSRDRNPWHYPLVLLAQAAALPMLFIPIWIELKSPIMDGFDAPLLCLSILLFVYAVVLLMTALASGHVNFGWVALGSLLPLLGFAQFAYLTFYKPAYERPKVDVATRIEKVNSSRGVTRLLGTVTLQNKGEASADVLGAMFTVTGHRMESAEGMGAGKVSQLLDLSEPDRHHFGKFVSLLSFDDLMATGESLAPGESRTRSFVFDARDGGQNFVRLTVYVSTATPTGDSKLAPCKTQPRSSNVCTRTNFPASSWARKILGDDPFSLTTVHFASLPKGPPYLSTEYHSASRVQRKEAEAIDPLARNQFVQSIAEYRLDP
ncbi:hypothetical protein GCM10010347_58030 [Streptomyces cirratus]|uniref:Uncharacterized protein n=1 Tax=Streptomyces cirratus TaxID=68187 RepID=A0ABQ3F442_9ACTN|nr:hypothetical protein [Streptomyces cirratus]GHB79843.1 hypothetical protein GCM10010347_58030 [Streptomyces cirratus]